MENNQLYINKLIHANDDDESTCNSLIDLLDRYNDINYKDLIIFCIVLNKQYLISNCLFKYYLLMNDNDISNILIGCMEICNHNALEFLTESVPKDVKFTLKFYGVYLQIAHIILHNSDIMNKNIIKSLLRNKMMLSVVGPETLINNVLSNDKFGIKEIKLCLTNKKIRNQDVKNKIYNKVGRYNFMLLFMVEVLLIL